MVFIGIRINIIAIWIVVAIAIMVEPGSYPRMGWVEPL
jgi:hypothetical protein